MSDLVHIAGDAHPEHMYTDRAKLTLSDSRFVYAFRADYADFRNRHADIGHRRTLGRPAWADGHQRHDRTTPRSSTLTSRATTPTFASGASTSATSGRLDTNKHYVEPSHWGKLNPHRDMPDENFE